MNSYRDMLQSGVFCKDCGAFISDNAKAERQCPQCHEDELVRAVQEDIWPDETTHDEWMDIRRKYSGALEE